jgi:hypothetical protein
MKDEAEVGADESYDYEGIIQMDVRQLALFLLRRRREKLVNQEVSESTLAEFDGYVNRVAGCFNPTEIGQLEERAYALGRVKRGVK